MNTNTRKDLTIQLFHEMAVRNRLRKSNASQHLIAQSTERGKAILSSLRSLSTYWMPGTCRKLRPVDGNPKYIAFNISTTNQEMRVWYRRDVLEVAA